MTSQESKAIEILDRSNICYSEELYLAYKILKSSIINKQTEVRQLKNRISSIADTIDLKVKDGQWLPSIVASTINDLRELSE